MKFYQVMRSVSRKEQLSYTAIAELLGKSRGYITTVVSRKTEPRTDNAASMLDACGWVLAALPKDDVPESALVIDVASDTRTKKALEDKAAELERRARELRRKAGASDEELIG